MSTPGAPQNAVSNPRYRARSTSAAPGYFKPFVFTSCYKPTPELMDGGILHNNPADIVLEEAQRLAETSHQMRPPDIVLSVGTGQPIPPGPASAPPVFAKGSWWLPRLYTVIINQVRMNIDTEKRWRAALRQNRDLDKRMHRVNPDLGREPPAMDEVGKLDKLRNQVQAWLTARIQRSKITEIACILVASSFYFERSGNARSSTSVDLPGFIKCRFSGDRDGLIGLGTFLAAASLSVYLDIHRSPSGRGSDRKRFPVEAMNNIRRWDDVGLLVKIPGEDVVTTISIDRPNICHNSRQFHIGGFPRPLMKADFGGKQI